MSKISTMLVALLILGAPSLTPAGPKEDVTAATQAWIDAMNSHDPERVVALYDPEAVLWGVGSGLSCRHASRSGPSVPRRHPHHHAALRQRPRSFPRLDLGRVAGLSGVPRRRLDAGAVPQLPAKDDRLWRMSLPGVCLDRRCGEYRSGVYIDTLAQLRRSRHTGGDRSSRISLPLSHYRAFDTLRFVPSAVEGRAGADLVERR